MKNLYEALQAITNPLTAFSGTEADMKKRIETVADTAQKVSDTFKEHDKYGYVLHELNPAEYIFLLSESLCSNFDITDSDILVMYGEYLKAIQFMYRKLWEYYKAAILENVNMMIAIETTCDNYMTREFG